MQGQSSKVKKKQPTDSCHPRSCDPHTNNAFLKICSKMFGHVRPTSLTKPVNVHSLLSCCVFCYRLYVAHSPSNYTQGNVLTSLIHPQVTWPTPPSLSPISTFPHQACRCFPLTPCQIVRIAMCLMLLSSSRLYLMCFFFFLLPVLDSPGF